MVSGGQADRLLGVRYGLTVQTAPAGCDARLAVGQIARGIERDRSGGRDERAIGVVIGQLRLAQQTETVEVIVSNCPSCRAVTT